MLDKEKLLNDIKVLSKIDNADYDSILNLVIDVAVDEVKAYICCHDELPKALQNIMLGICMNHLTIEGYGIPTFTTMPIKSVQRGDTNITYTEAKKSGIEEIVELYKSKLNPFKKVKTL